VLLNDRDELLLLKMIDQMSAGGETIWITVGGGVEEGESYEEAAVRECWEETGMTQVEWGPLIGIREVVKDDRHPVCFMEHYYLARTRSSVIHTERMTQEEKRGYLEHRWWSLEELEQTNERIVPEGLSKWLRPILEGRLPIKPVVLDLSFNNGDKG